MYVPPYQALLNRFARSRDRAVTDRQIAVPLPLFRLLLQFAISTSDFDEEAYLRANPDVATAIANGRVETAFDHFIGFGYFEGRRGAFEVDEAWYRSTYPDVDAAIAAGQLRSAADHFYEIGGAEGRGPSAAQTENAVRWKTALVEPG